jgi:hypothetical protein
VTTRKGAFTRRAGRQRRFEHLPEAVQFVMEAVPEPSRATAMIHAAVGPSLQIDEITTRYEGGE